MEIFILDDEGYIELHDLLKVMGIYPTGGTAKAAISGGMVRVDGNVEFRKRCKLKEGQMVEAAGRSIKIAGSGREVQA